MDAEKSCHLFFSRHQLMAAAQEQEGEWGEDFFALGSSGQRPCELGFPRL